MTMRDQPDYDWELEQHVPDLERIERYGLGHTDEYGGHWLEDHVFLGVAFTDALPEHEPALKTLLDLPNRLRAVRCDFSLAHLRQVQAELHEAEMRQGRAGATKPEGVIGLGLDVRRNVVVVRVLTECSDVAERLKSQYGPVVDIEFGGPAIAF